MEFLNLLKKMTPEIVEKIETRYLILRTIAYNEPIGRRLLSTKLSMKERAIRDEVSFLKEQGLLNIEILGMYITEDGQLILDKLEDLYIQLKGIPILERELERVLNVKRVIISPGNSLNNELVLKDMGKITSKEIKNIIENGNIIGITGGNTMAAVAEEMVEDNKERQVLIIPARGGLGLEVETQANSIAALLGQKLNGKYRLLYVPDSLESEALDIILKNSEIKESIECINKMDTLVFGMGRADVMATRRNLSPDKIKDIIQKGAVAEAFGHYFDINGREIWEYKTIGLSLEKYKELKNVIGVAGGEDKAEVIIAIATIRNDITIITDEEAARKILEIVHNATK